MANQTPRALSSLFASLALVACGGNAQTNGAKNGSGMGAGGSGDSGSGSSGRGGAGLSGAANYQQPVGGAAGVGGTQVVNDDCIPHALDCTPQNPGASDCPASIESLKAQCNQGASNYTTANSCGGLSWDASFGLGGTEYYFDAVGHVVGIEYFGDVQNSCPDGGTSSSTLYGQRCASIGPQDDPCVGITGDGGAGGALDTNVR